MTAGRKGHFNLAKKPEASGNGAGTAFAAPLERSSPTAEVAKRIIAHVESGDLKPGTRLPSERQLSELLGVGRSTVREAIATLDLLGILNVRPGAGTFIKNATSDLLPDSIKWGLLLGRPRTLHLIEARRHIEAILAQLAAERVTPESAAKLRDCYRKMEAATSSRARFVKADIAFHLQIAAMADNSVLTDMLRSVRTLLEVWIRRAIDSAEELRGTLNEHQAILVAVEAGDGKTAHAAMTRHMAFAAGRLQRSLEAGGDDAGRAEERPSAGV